MCTNTIGSFVCSCDPGFELGDDERTCIGKDITSILVQDRDMCALYYLLADVDECANGDHNCDINAMCNNTIGSFTCICNSGYSGNGTSGTCSSMYFSALLPLTCMQYTMIEGLSTRLLNVYSQSSGVAISISLCRY